MKEKTFLTTGQVQEILRMTARRVSLAETAARFGCSERQVSVIRSQHGVARPARRPITTEELTRAEELLKDGCSYSEVARTLDRSTGVLRKHLPGYGWPTNRTGKTWQLEAS